MTALVVSCVAGEASVANSGQRGEHHPARGGKPRAARPWNKAGTRGAWEASTFPSRTGGDSDLWLYRERTAALLRRYLRLSVETGRLPSLLGREFFRTRVTTYHLTTFEDAVIFVHDVERSLEKLRAADQQMIARIALQEYTQEEVARMLHCCRQTIGRMYSEALDRTTEIFLAMGLMEPFPSTEVAETCQEGKLGGNAASV
jgi:DNA-directed RNA polymerase specialized sigma24 family protein